MYLAILDNKQEPEATMNHILGVLVEELSKLQDGFEFAGTKYHVQLWNIAADDPGEFLLETLWLLVFVIGMMMFTYLDFLWVELPENYLALLRHWHDHLLVMK